MKSPFRLSIRPTEDFVREAVFNILQGEFVGKRVADFFAGTGALGLEAISRGAESALFVDKSVSAIKLISQNIEALDFKSKTRLIKGDVFVISKKLIADAHTFDVIFLDPPYEGGISERIMQSSILSDLLCEGGIAALEVPSKNEIKDVPLGLKVFDHRKWSKCAFILMEKERNNENQE